MNSVDHIEKTHPENPFRSENNTRYTKGLFYETSRNPDSVMYTLKDLDYKGYPSLFRLYISEEDDTEYTFATKYLEGWEHWELLCECTWFKPFVSRWRKELYLKKTASLLKIISSEASDKQSKNRFQAAKYLLDKEWEKNVPSTKKRGRPSKEEVSAELLLQAEDLRRQQEDFSRINDYSRRELKSDSNSGETIGPDDQTRLEGSGE